MGTTRGTDASETFLGTDGDDLIFGNGGHDLFWPGPGDDDVFGGSGDDTFHNSRGDDLAAGGTGNDRFRYGERWGPLDEEEYDGDTGFDMLVYEAPARGALFDARPDIYGYGFATGGLSFRSIERVEFEGGGSDDRAYLTAGPDWAHGREDHDSLYGRSGDDRLKGGSGNDRLAGDEGADRLGGGSGDDRLFGGSGSDRLRGGTGNDDLVGNTGADRLLGGAGADAFVFQFTSHSGREWGVDRIEDFERGLDIIDIAGIDANAFRSGDQQAFFIGTDAFDGIAGELRYVSGWSSRVVQLDRDGDARADFELVVEGAGGLGAYDFIV